MRSERPIRLGRKGYDVMQVPLGLREEFADIARRLADALLVLDQRDTHKALAVLAEADAGRYGNTRVLQQQLGEFERTQMREHLWDRRPGEHCGRRRRDRPTCPGQRIHEAVAPAAINLPDLVDAVLRAVQRRSASDLD